MFSTVLTCLDWVSGSCLFRRILCTLRITLNVLPTAMILWRLCTDCAMCLKWKTEGLAYDMEEDGKQILLAYCQRQK